MEVQKLRNGTRKQKRGRDEYVPGMRTWAAEAILGLDTGLFIAFLCGQELGLASLGHRGKGSECNRLRQTEEVEREMTSVVGICFRLRSAEECDVTHSSRHRGPSP